MKPHASTLRGRPPNKRDQVVRYVRRRIVEGHLQPGDPVTGHEGLMRRFQATSTTVEQAMNQLQAQGFVAAQRRRGTFVAPHPPHVSQYALAFPWGEAHAQSQFYLAIRREAEKLNRPERRVSLFFNQDGDAGSADFQRLATHVANHCLAGLIFAYHPHHLIGWPILETKGLPRVAIISAPNFPGIPAVSPDLADFLGKALDHMVARGRRRVAVITLAQDSQAQDTFAAQFGAAVAARGLESRPWWLQSAAATTPRWAGNVAQLLMVAAPAERPDALIIFDDNLVEHATAGLAEADLHTPVELEIVAHANFPYPTPSKLPVTRLGFDVARLLAVCLDQIDRQRQGQPVPPLTLLPSVFATLPSSTITTR